MNYDEYLQKCRGLSPDILLENDNLYSNPIRLFSPKSYSSKAINSLNSLAKSVKTTFDKGQRDGIYDDSDVCCLKDIWLYENELKDICNDLVSKLEKNMFGCYLYVDKIYIYRTKKIEIRESSYLWHYDNNPNEIVKSIIYLNDVNQLNSPFEYLIDANEKGVLRKGTRLGTKKWDPAPNDGRVEDEVDALISTSNYTNVKLTGTKFTTCAFITNVFHRANPIIDGYRDVLNIRVKPTTKKPNEYINRKWTSSYEVSGAVNRNPELDWRSGIQTNKDFISIIKSMIKKLFQLNKNNFLSFK